MDEWRLTYSLTTMLINNVYKHYSRILVIQYLSDTCCNFNVNRKIFKYMSINDNSFYGITTAGLGRTISFNFGLWALSPLKLKSA